MYEEFQKSVAEWINIAASFGNSKKDICETENKQKCSTLTVSEIQSFMENVS